MFFEVQTFLKVYFNLWIKGEKNPDRFAFSFSFSDLGHTLVFPHEDSLTEIILTFKI